MARHQTPDIMSDLMNGSKQVSNKEIGSHNNTASEKIEIPQSEERQGIESLAKTSPPIANPLHIPNTNEKKATYKVTFSIPLEILNAFNSLYGRLIQEGRHKEKAQLICEAIQLLIEKEKNHSH